MSVPKVEISVPDNQLGIRAPVGAVLAILAVAADGDIAVPKTFTRVPDVVSEFSGGPLVEQAAYAIERRGLTVLCTRVEKETDGTQGALDDNDFAGTSVVTIDGAVDPIDDYEVVVEFLTGTAAIGTAGATYRESYDGGHTWGATKALGTANTLTVPNAVKFNFAAGTIVAGDILRTVCIAPAWGDTTLATAFDGLKMSAALWTRLAIYGDLDSSGISVVDAKMEVMSTAGRPRRVIGHTRGPASGEDESEYLAALTSELGNSSSRRLALCAGRCKTDSSTTPRRRYRRPPSIAVAALSASQSEEIDLAELDLGPLPGVYIRDANNNPDEHDEEIHPGLDDQRFLTLRTWEGRTGVYVNNPRLFSPVGSDYLYLQFGLVVDLVCMLVRTRLQPILNKGVFVVPDGSGKIDPEVATAIEGLINGILTREVVGLRKATRARFFLDRNADVLRTGIQPWKVRVVPLAYIKSMPGEVALTASEVSPALVAG